MKHKWKIAAAVLCAVALVTVAYAATAGGQNDPLVTLGYLNNIFSAQVDSQVEQAVSGREDQLRQDLDQAIEDWDEQVRDAIGEGGSGETSNSVFQVVTLTRGQTLVGDVGCEVMLRIGTARCVSDSTPGLIDVSEGGTLNNGQNLATNHLYMVTISTRSVEATSNTVKVLVRGPYTVR